MKLLIEKVKKAKVLFEDNSYNEINEGLLIYLGVHEQDSIEDVLFSVNKLYNLRFMEDENGKMNLSYKDKEYEVLVISNFSLYGNFKKGNRPSFIESANPIKAENLYNIFCEELSKKIKIVKMGRFRTYMEVSSVNDGPINLILDTKS